MGNGAHGIVGYACWDGTADPSGIRKERCKRTLAAIIKINVDSTIVREDKVADGVGALNGVRVTIKGLEKPWIFFTYEFS